MGLGQESGKGEGMVTDMLHGDITCVIQTSFLASSYHRNTKD